MNASIVSLAGDVKGAVVPLDDHPLSIGRDESSTIRVGGAAVSRHHCKIERREDGFTITDLESMNGTYVNDVPIKVHRLKHGDRIRVGDCIFRYQDDSGTGILRGGTACVEMVDGAPTGPTSLIRPLEEATLFSSTEPAASHGGRLAASMNALVKFGTSVNSLRGADEIEFHLVDLLLDVFPASRAAVLLLDGKDGRLIQAFGRDRRGDAGGPIRVSSTIARRVLGEEVAILSNDVPRSGDFGTAASVVEGQVHSVLAVPMKVRDRRLGVIYLDASDSKSRFDDEHLRLLSALAGIAAVALDNARHFHSLQDEMQRLREDIDLQHDLLGESPAMRRIRDTLAKVAASESTILIRGESGTGKELAARAIVRASARRDRPFIAINCAALPETLLESELFGHEKGAFTGAVALKKGKMEAADGGTVFLDEIGELAPALQAKLLRFLETHEFERVGGTMPVRVDIRILAATNRDLEKAMGEGSIRRDLFYRLNVITIVMPPLRDRKEEIPLLASHFLARCAAKCKRRVMGFSDEARRCLVEYDWPGNVRELENAIERAVVLGSGDLVQLEDLPDSLLEAVPVDKARDPGYQLSVREAKRKAILDAFDKAHGSHQKAARLLGVNPNYLHRLVRNLDLRSALKESGTRSPAQVSRTEEPRPPRTDR